MSEKRPASTESGDATTRSLSPEWKGRLRLTVLILILCSLVGLLSVKFFRLSGATTAEEYAEAMQRHYPVYPLDN